MKSFNKTSHDACSKVSGVEFTDVCAGCDPNRCVEPSISPLHETLKCPKCNKEVCRDKQLNRCHQLQKLFSFRYGSRLKVWSVIKKSALKKVGIK